MSKVYDKLPIQREFEAAFDKVFKYEKLYSPQSVGRIVELRPSQLPFCALSFWTVNASQSTHRLMSMSMAYYTSVGTTVHEVLQRYLALTHRFVADWECKICGKKNKFSHENMCCDELMEYHELTVRQERPHGVVSGHIDGVYRDKTGRYWIIDYKTTGLDSVMEKIKDPPIAYRHQVRMYAYLLWLQYGIKVAGVMLVFIPRDKPHRRETWAELVEDEEFTETMPQLLDMFLKRHHYAMRISTLESALKLVNQKPCGDPYCDVCELPLEEKELAIRRSFKSGVRNEHLPLIETLGGKQ